MDFKLYRVPRFNFGISDSVTAFRILFLVPILLILGLSIGFNRVNRHMVFYAAQVDNSQNVLSALSDLSMVLHEVNFNIVAHNAYGNTSNKELALENARKLGPLTHRLDSLVGNSPDQAALSDTISRRIAILYEISASRSEQDFAFFNRPGRLRIPNTSDMRIVYELIEEMKSNATTQMNGRLENRNNYQAQLFKYNWLLMIASVIFMAAVFYSLDKNLRQNRKYRADLENKIENLDRSNAELEQFAYSASHDLQEPLRKIKSFSDRVLQKHATGLNSESQLLLEKVSGSAGRMQRLILDLLAFSQLMRTTTSKEKVSLNKVLREVRSNLSLIIQEKNAVISSDDLPEVSAYPSQMIQLFQNLIENSLKYSRPDLAPAIGISHTLVKGSEIENCMPAHKALNFHEITITDNGIGFEGEFAEKVFALFQRLHGRTDYQGTGIGLAICKRVITNHNGYIRAKAISGLGASFSFYLPEDDQFTLVPDKKTPESSTGSRG